MGTRGGAKKVIETNEVELKEPYLQLLTALEDYKNKVMSISRF